jgi:hypothetical protein
MPPSRRQPAKEKATADRDPGTGLPAGPAPTAPPGDGTAATDDTAGQVVPVAADGTIGDDYEPMGETGAVNAHGELAAGMPEASEALSEAERSAVDEPTLRRRGFLDAGNGRITATRTVSVEFLPHNAGDTKSRIRLFTRGLTYSRAAVAAKCADYAARDGAELVYSD